jgi:hypothetical protein
MLKESLSSNDQQLHQHQQIEQPAFILNHGD